MCGNTGKIAIVDSIDFADDKMLDWVMQDSNVVINLIGPRKYVRDWEDIKNINIDIPI